MSLKIESYRIQTFPLSVGNGKKPTINMDGEWYSKTDNVYSFNRTVAPDAASDSEQSAFRTLQGQFFFCSLTFGSVSICQYGHYIT